MKPVILCLALGLIFVTAAAAGDPKPPTSPTPRQERAREIDQILADARVRIALLLDDSGTDLAGSRDLETQREVARIKREAHIAVLQTQLRFANEDNHPDAARKLEELIDHLRNPRDHRTGPGQPRNKPAHR